MIPLLEVGLQILNKVIPDKTAREAAQLKLLEQQQAGVFREMDDQLKRDLGQMDVNKAEASSTDSFRGGWRPACGYVCVAGMAYQFLVQPLLGWASGIWAVPTPPVIHTGDLLMLLGGMLGLGSLRTTEKIKGIK